MKYASIVFDTAITKPLDYAIEKDLLGKIHIGMQVAVLVRGHQKIGYVFALKKNTSCAKVLPIQKIISTEALTKDLFTLALWMAQYYCTPLSKVIKCMLPTSIRKDIQPQKHSFISANTTKAALAKLCSTLVKKHPAQAKALHVILQTKKGILLSELLEKAQISKSPIETLVKKKILKEKKIVLDPQFTRYFLSAPKILNEEQKKALENIYKSIESTTFATHLLFGITGSGKTEVYLQAIQKVLDQKKTVLLLVPEIALTSQTIERFRSRFKNRLAVLHYKKSHGEKSHSWKEIFSGKVDIVIGARSALFAPLPNLGLIIIDEEHDLSYKQVDQAPTYHARQVAIMRAKFASCPVILGSATPSFESFYNAKNNKYLLSTLTKRANLASLSKVTLVDMRLERAKTKSYFSEPLLEGIKQRYVKGEQTILFLNRRGFHSFLLCQKCSEVLHCPHCDLSLTYHKKSHILQCHSCGYRTHLDQKCPSCSSKEHWEYKGFGTEHVQAALHRIFPDIRTLRMDRDTTTKKNSHEQLFKEFRSGKADVLIGTQMVVKGFHFPLVTLVGVLGSDGALNIPDFRSSEYVFQLLTQVAGRAGRSDLAGEVIIQTYMPENRTIAHAKNQDYLSFYQEEMHNREIFNYPPYTRMIKMQFSATDEQMVKNAGNKYRALAIKHMPSSTIIHPLIPAGRYKSKDIFRMFFCIRTKNITQCTALLMNIKEEHPLPKGIKLLIDVDPITTYF